MSDGRSAVDRLRVTFGVSGPMRYCSVLDHGRTWERLLQRAGLPLAYSQGYNPHPRIQFASALPVGYSSQCERLDLYLTTPVAAQAALAVARPQCPQGLELYDCQRVPLKDPALQASLTAAHYLVQVESQATPADLQCSIEHLLARRSIIRQRRKKGREVPYDLRELVITVQWKSAAQGLHTLFMALRCSSKGSGRPEEILAELDIACSGYSIHRTRLFWEDEERSP